MDNRRKRELDTYVNEIFKKSSQMGPTIGMTGLVREMGECNLTERHLPNHVLEILFGEQLLSPAKISSMTTLDLENVFSKHNSEITSLTNKWLGKQEVETTADNKMTKVIKTTRNSLKPEVADIIRKRLSQVISMTTIIFAQSICDQILIVTEFIEQIIRAAGYLFGTEVEGGQRKEIVISSELTKCYETVAYHYFNDPRLNYRRDVSQSLRPIDFVFFVNTAAAISTGLSMHVTLKRVKQDIKTLRKRIKNVKDLSETDKLFEDFFVAAFTLPGQDIRGLSQKCSEPINAANEKILQTVGTPAIREIKSELQLDFVRKANESAKNIFMITKPANMSPPPADIQDIQQELNDIISETNSI